MDWHNLGLWTAAGGDYETAATALARRLGTAAELAPGHRILDVGVGAGAQLRQWRQRFGVSQIVAIEPDAALAARAGALVADSNQLPEGLFDRVLALDCAYHFNDQSGFFRQAHDRLVPGGRLVFTDLVGEASRPLLYAARLCSIPGRNVRPSGALRHQLRQAGFDATITTLRDVLTGYARYGSPHARVRVVATRLLCAMLAERLDYVLVCARR